MDWDRPTEHFDELVSGEAVRARCKELGQEISQHYGNEPLVAVGILRGCFMFFGELVRNLHCPAATDFMFVSSYGNAMKSSGTVKIERDLEMDIASQHVLLIDDIVDTGRTLSNLVKMLKVRKPKSIEVCAMLDKKSQRRAEVDVKFSAFDIDNHFVVGFGLDYRQQFRNMDFIGKLKEGHQPLLDEYLDSLGL